jgi:hypothetical protein
VKRVSLSRTAPYLLLAVVALGLLVLIWLSASQSESGAMSQAIGAVGAVVVALLFRRLDLALLLEILESLGVVVPLFAYLVVTVLMGPTPGTTHFSEIGAQVIVVLLLALAVDARFFRLKPERDRFEVGAVLFTMLLLATGEFYALKSLLTDSPSHSEVVAGAIAAGFAGVAVTSISGPTRSKTEQGRIDPE